MSWELPNLSRKSHKLQFIIATETKCYEKLPRRDRQTLAVEQMSLELKSWHRGIRIWFEHYFLTIKPFHNFVNNESEWNWRESNFPGILNAGHLKQIIRTLLKTGHGGNVGNVANVANVGNGSNGCIVGNVGNLCLLPPQEEMRDVSNRLGSWPGDTGSLVPRLLIGYDELREVLNRLVSMPILKTRKSCYSG